MKNTTVGEREEKRWGKTLLPNSLVSRSFRRRLGMGLRRGTVSGGIKDGGIFVLDVGCCNIEGTVFSGSVMEMKTRVVPALFIALT